jgi:hypothetical protein
MVGIPGWGEVKLKAEWIRCNGYKNLPVGNWLVLVDDPREEKRVQACTARANVTLVGGIFAFDAKPVIAYMPQPSAWLD